MEFSKAVVQVDEFSANSVQQTLSPKNDKKNDEIGFEENLPTFWESISGEVQKLMYAQTLYDKKALGVN